MRTLLLTLLLSLAARAEDVVRLGNLKFAHYGAVSHMKEVCPKYGVRLEERMFAKGIDIVRHHRRRGRSEDGRPEGQEGGRDARRRPGDPTSPGFQVTPDNAPAVAEITAHLDGLPLAIELAATRTKLLTPQQMLPRLQHRLSILSSGVRTLPERQRTLRGAIA